MTELLTAAQMRAIEAEAIASGSVTGLELMERAGQGVVEAVFAEWPALATGAHRAVVLCGPGNNGGDGFVVARLLKEAGWAVEVFLYGDAEKLPPDARVNCERWVGMGGVVTLDAFSFVQTAFSGASRRNDFASGAPVVFDALFGTGLTRPLTGDLAKIVGLLSDMKEFGHGAVVAVDLPSGLCADSGRVLGAAPAAALTVTFHRAKQGHFLAEGPQLCGRLHCVDIGLQGSGQDLALVEPRLDRVSKSLGHKFGYGHALVLSGPTGQGGAARMTARGGLRIGAGLVTLACPPEALAENAGRLDAIMLKQVADGAGLEAILQDPRITALCLGPGLGLDARAAGLVRTSLQASRPRVKPGAPGEPVTPLARDDHAPYRSAPLRLALDADALTLISRDPSLFALLHEDCVLTPHGGEFARLFPDIAAKLEAPATKGPAYSKVDATREAAARAGCTVLFKGPDTVIASPDGTCAINSAAYDRAAPWLATAGSGDVLAGFITGLLARGFRPQEAAETGAWLHVECARSFGPGLIAEDLPDELPKVFRHLGL